MTTRRTFTLGAGFAAAGLVAAPAIAKAQTVSWRMVTSWPKNLPGPGVAAQMLADRGILYAPDYLVNCGGVVQAPEELGPAVGAAEPPRLAGWLDLDRARARVAGVYDTTLRVLDRADAEGILPVRAAAREAEERIAAGGPAFERFAPKSRGS